MCVNDLERKIQQHIWNVYMVELGMAFALYFASSFVLFSYTTALGIVSFGLSTVNRHDKYAKRWPAQSRYCLNIARGCRTQQIQISADPIVE